MILTIQNKYLRLSNTRHKSNLDEILGYYEGDTFAGKDEVWVSLVREEDDTLLIPTGLASIVIDYLRDVKEEFTVVDGRMKPAVYKKLQWINEKTPRPYQEDALNKAVTVGRGIWSIATGLGKMLTAAHLIYRLKHRTTFFVYGQEALKDTYNELLESISGTDIGIWSGDEKRIGWITIVMVQSVFTDSDNSELIDHIMSSDILICDEFHHAASKEYYDAIMLSDAYYRIGMSGTAYRSDKKAVLLYATTGKLLYQITQKQGQELGYLAPSEIYFIQTEQPGHLDKEYVMRMTPHDKYLETIVYNDSRNEMLANVVRAILPFYFVLCIVKYKEHGEILAEKLGLPFVFGDSPKKFREAIKKGLDSKQLRGAIATKIYDESVNIVGLSAVINFSGHSPKHAQTQRHGRCLRLEDGKIALNIDAYDGWMSNPKRHSDNRVSYMKEEGHDVNFVTYDAMIEIIWRKHGRTAIINSGDEQNTGDPGKDFGSEETSHKGIN